MDWQVRLRTYFSVSYYAFLFSIMSASLFILFIILNALAVRLSCEDGALVSHPNRFTFRQSICIVHTHFCFPTILPIIILLDIMCCHVHLCVTMVMDRHTPIAK